MQSEHDLPNVEILLATYNGERFLREQIDSILAQDYKNLTILARDDGSSDRTLAILDEYAQRFPHRFRRLPQGIPTGNAKDNFLLLMKSSTAPYVCFSDQDDVWLTDKVSLAKEAMNRLESRWGPDRPLLSFSDLRVVDDALRTLHKSFWKQAEINPDSILSLNGLLSQNVVTGCTAMINRPLLELALQMPEEASMHDRWIALLVSIFGKAEVVRSQTVLYRQHDRNVIGVQERTGSFSELVKRAWFGDQRRIEYKISMQQARALLRVHNKDLPVEKRRLLEAYLRYGTGRSRLKRIGTMVRYRLFRTGLRRNLATIVDILRWNVDIN